MRTPRRGIWLVLLGALACTACAGDTDTDTDPGTEVSDDTDSETVVFVDGDGNEYDTVVLGEQIWMARNLASTSFADGTPIREWVRDDNWFEGGGTVPMFRWSDTNDLNDLYEDELPYDFYGAQYNEAVLASGSLAPEGWRLPTADDVRTLEAFLGEEGHRGREADALKSTSGWAPSSGNGTDDVGFTGLPAGYVASTGTATGAGAIATWATSTTNPAEKTRTTVTLLDEPTLLYFDNRIELGAAVRLLRDR